MLIVKIHKLKKSEAFYTPTNEIKRITYWTILNLFIKTYATLTIVLVSGYGVIIRTHIYHLTISLNIKVIGKMQEKIKAWSNNFEYLVM